MVVVGSQDVIAAKCCPGHWQHESKRRKKWVEGLKRIQIHVFKIQYIMRVYYESRFLVCKSNISEKYVEAGSFLIEGALL